MNILKSKIRFDASGFYLFGVLALIVAGFWPSYFAKFFDGSLNYSGYFHFHAVIALLWIIILITQPILIRKRKLKIHRIIGKSTYLLFPLIIISVVLLAHSRIPFYKEKLVMEIFTPFKDLFTLSVAFSIAIIYRRKIELHARGMIATGIIFIEPALARFNWRILDGISEYQMMPYIVTVLFIYLILIILIIGERKRQTGRWIFPLILGLLVAVHSVRIFSIEIGIWKSFVDWFVTLPLT